MATDDVCERQPNEVIPDSFRERYKGFTFSQAVRKVPKSGNSCPWKGKQRPIEVCKKISKSVTEYHQKRKEGTIS